MGHSLIDRKRNRRWCPVCYLQWDPDTSIEPLAWSISLKRICSLHGCELAEHCRSCGRAQPVRTRYRTRRACRFCRTPLGWAAEAVSAQLGPLDCWVDAQVDQVIMLCADPTQKQLPADRFRQFLDTFRSLHGDRVDLPPALKSAVSLWRYKPSSTISLRKLLSLAAMHGCAVIDILLDPVRTAQREPLFGFWQGFEFLPLKPGACLRESTRLQMALRNLLRRESVCYLPPLSLVAEHVSCTPSEIPLVMGEVLSAYRQARARHQEAPNSVVLERAIPAALDALKTLGLPHVKRRHLFRVVPRLAAVSGLSLSDTRRVAQTALILRRAKRAHNASQVALPDAARDAIWLQ